MLSKALLRAFQSRKFPGEIELRDVPWRASHTIINRSGSRYGSGRKRRLSARENTPTLVPIPIASDPMAVAAKPGFLSSPRIA
jgi:hypothetical protein